MNPNFSSPNKTPLDLFAQNLINESFSPSISSQERQKSIKEVTDSSKKLKFIFDLLQKTSSHKKENISREISTHATNSIATKLEDKFEEDQLRFSEFTLDSLSSAGIKLSKLSAFNDLFGDSLVDSKGFANRIHRIDTRVPEGVNMGTSLLGLFNDIRLK